MFIGNAVEDKEDKNVVDLIWCVLSRLRGYIQYSLVGLLGAVIHFTVLWYLTDKLHIWYILSATLAITLASMNNFTLNYLWTFRNRKHQITNIFIGWVKFLLSIGMTEVVYLGLLYVFTDKCGLYYLLSAFLSLSCTTVVRYVTADKWIWRARRSKSMRMVARRNGEV